MIRALVLASLIAAVPVAAAAHNLVVFASVDCNTVLVEAQFSNGNAVQQAEVRVLNGQNDLLTSMPVGENGTVVLDLDSLDHAEGLLIEVDTGSHDNYWIVTPDDIARGCES